MNLAAVLAVAHSPLAGGLSQFADVGAMVIIWDSVIESSPMSLNENESGDAAVRPKRARMGSVERILAGKIRRWGLNE